MEHRASSIAKNVLKIPASKDSDKEDIIKAGNITAKIKIAYNDADKEAYSARVGNIAAKIKAAVLEPKKGYQEWPHEIAARILHETAFCKFKQFADMKAENSTLLELHCQIKASYKALLKGHKQLNAKLEYVLPKDNEALFCLVEAQQQNHRINHLIRLGKIVHYAAISPDNASLAALQSSPRTIINNWPEKQAVEESRFWSSAGQTEIKQNEAFVRVWRGALAFAARSLKDWADPEDKIPGDILLKQQEALDNFNADYFNKKYQILFGGQCGLSAKEHKSLLAFSLKGIYALRNAAFHFNSLTVFVKALMPEEEPPQAELHEFLGTFYTKSCRDYRLKQKKIMEGAHFHQFFSEAEIQTIWQVLTSAKPGSLPLPRLKHVLERAQDAWKGEDRLSLPPYSTAEERESSAWAHCQYTAVKLLYDGRFRNWLEERNQAAVGRIIKQALEHTSQAAQNISSRGKDKEFKEFITAKAGKIAELGNKENFKTLFSALMAETATEMRVQKFYQSDGQAAREQADYIEKFKCDNVALAFADYLRATLGAGNVAAFCKLERKERPGDKSVYDRLPLEQNSAAELWQSRLYFLLHLMPVEEAGSLRQQLKKWEIVTDKSHGEQGRGGEILARLLAVFDLYIAMHDAQFVGAELVLKSDEETAKALFANQEDFRKSFPKKESGAEDEHLPIRGLREMRRFGTGLLHNLYEKHKIASASVARWQELKQTIAREQDKLKKLHGDWVNSKRKRHAIQWTSRDANDYNETLALVIEYRHLTAQIMLQNHVHVHRLLMKILGRLVDFAGLWERDLYFVLLALLYQKGMGDIKEEFKDEGAMLETGQIVKALRKLKDTDRRAEIAAFLNKEEVGEIRNSFYHFDTLKKEYFPINLTAEVNKARQLMAYDRKLKNAVTKSLVDLLKRENIILKWDMGADHKLSGPISVVSAKTCHLDKESDKNKIEEELCGKHFIAMIKSLFTGR